MKSKNTSIILSIILMCFAFIATFSVTFARYLVENSHHTTVASDKCFFSSDYINGAGVSKFSLEDFDITFHLYNFDDYEFTETNINYTITVSATNSFDGFSLSSSSGTLIGGQSSTATIVLSVESDFINNTELTITVVASGEYNKTLTKKIALINIITQGTANKYYIDDSAGALYLNLHILANSNIDSGTITIAWDTNELGVDNTNYYVNLSTKTMNGNIISGILINNAISIGSEISIRFFKQNVSENYAISFANALEFDTIINI